MNTAYAECTYCHLPIPARLKSDRDEPLYCCFGCRLAAEITHGHGEEGHATWMLARLGSAIVLSMAVMVFSLPLYGLDVYGAEPEGVMAHIPGLLRYTSLLATSIVLILLGLPLLTNAVEQIARGIVTTDLLIVLGVTASIAYSYVSTVRGEGQTYFETACMILILVTLGRYLEATGKNSASASLRDLEKLLPEEVEIIRDGQTAKLRREQISIGDLVRVKAGARIPADGEITAGEAHVDEGIVTGESEPVIVHAGDRVRAGSLNLDGLLTLRVTGVGAESAIGRLIAAVETARRQKTSYERMADRAVRWFLPVVLAIAVAAGLFAYQRAGLDAAIMTGLAVVLISCPCALGIATPLAAWVAVDRAARHGIVFRSATALEALASVRAVAFDKTGTLTDAEPTVTSFEVLNQNGITREDLLSISASLASGSTHSVSRGVERYAHESAIKQAEVTSLQSIPGRGVTGTWSDHEVRLGSPAFVAGKAPTNTTTPAAGHTQTYLGIDDHCAGVFTLTESLRPETREALEQLMKLDCRVQVLTGDSAARAEQIARQLGVTTSHTLLPEDKLRLLSELRESQGPTAMVGDGLNDTPALVAADVGMAMGCGADVTRDAADVCLLGNDLRGVPWSIALARRGVRTMRSNLIWAAAYNLIGIPLACTGKLSPIFAALAMVVSSLIVVGNSLRLRRASLEVPIA